MAFPNYKFLNLVEGTWTAWGAWGTCSGTCDKTALETEQGLILVEARHVWVMQQMCLVAQE